MYQYDNKIQSTGERRDARAYNSFGNSAEGYNKKDYNKEVGYVIIIWLSRGVCHSPPTPCGGVRSAGFNVYYGNPGDTSIGQGSVLGTTPKYNGRLAWDPLREMIPPAAVELFKRSNMTPMVGRGGAPQGEGVYRDLCPTGPGGDGEAARGVLNTAEKNGDLKHV